MRVAVAAPLLLLVAACERAPAPSIVSFVGETMGTYYTVRVVDADGTADADSIKARVDALLREVNGRFSTWQPDSVISRFNASRSTEPFDVGKEFVDVLRVAIRIAAASDGAYDPTVLPLVRVLGFGPADVQVPPTAEEIAAARSRVGYRRLEIVDDARIRKTDPDVEIDLSSIAKGAGVDRVSELLTSLGYPDHMVEIGGEVRCRGRKPGDEPWRIGVERPSADAATRAFEQVVEVVDRAIATSGSYRNFRESGGTRLHHVLDARTGRNAPNGVVSVTVDAPDCALADGLATALMIVGPEAAPAILAGHPGAGLRVLYLLADEGGGVREVGIDW